MAIKGVSGTDQRSESPEMREKGHFVHANHVPDINSRKMKWVLLGGVSCMFLHVGEPSDFINEALCVGLEQVR